MHGGTLRRVAALFAMLLVLTGCQADFNVLVEVEEDGSGVVRTELVLDQAAVDGLLDNALALTDLADAGWRVGTPQKDEETGTTRRTLEKEFGTPEQFSEVMDDLSDTGLFRDFVLVREQSFGRVDYRVSGVIDPSGGLATFTDPELDTALGRPMVEVVTGPPYNASPDNINIEVSVIMPGQLQTNSAGATERQGVVVGSRSVSLSDTQDVPVNLASTRRSTSAQVLRGVAVVAAVLAALIAFAQMLRVISSLRKPSRPSKPRPTDARGRPSDQVMAEIPSQPEPEDPPFAGYRVVALDGHGVLYKEAAPVRDLLIPLARELGSPVPEDDIEAKARLLTLGRLTTSDFWRSIGVAGDVHELDAAYVGRQQLMPGVVKYLRAVRNNGVRVACVTDDCPAWAMRLRAAHSLDSLVDPWVISGSVGVAKPDPPVFEVLRRFTGEPSSAILVVDDDLDNLDMARQLGFGTAWFDPDGQWSEARGRDLFRNFNVAADVLASVGVETPPTVEPHPPAGW